MSNSVSGKITQILKVENGTTKAGKSWSKQSIVVDNGDKFNPTVCITFFGDKTDLLQGLTVGQDVTVHVNISSREFNGKYYHNIDGWKIEGGEQSQGQQQGDDNGGLPF